MRAPRARAFCIETLEDRTLLATLQFLEGTSFTAEVNAPNNSDTLTPTAQIDNPNLGNAPEPKMSAGSDYAAPDGSSGNALATIGNNAPTEFVPPFVHTLSLELGSSTQIERDVQFEYPVTATAALEGMAMIVPGTGDQDGDPVNVAVAAYSTTSDDGPAYSGKPETVNYSGSVAVTGPNGQSFSFSGAMNANDQTTSEMQVLKLHVGDVININFNGNYNAVGNATTFAELDADISLIAEPDIAVKTINWHPSTQDEWNAPDGVNPETGANAGGVDVTYTISDADLPQAAPIVLYWVDGLGNELSAPITTGDDGGTLMTETDANTSGEAYKIHVPASQLGVPPAGTKALMVTLDPSDSPNYVTAMVDNAPSAANTFQVNANSILSPYTLDGSEVDPVDAQTNDTNAAEIDATFRPAGGALTLDQAEPILGVTGFNWVQTISFPQKWTPLEFDVPYANITIRPTPDPATGVPLLDENGNVHLQAIPDIYYNYLFNEYETFIDENKNTVLDFGPPTQPGLPDEERSLASVGYKPLSSFGALDPLPSPSAAYVSFVVLQTTNQQSGQLNFSRVSLPSLGTDPEVWTPPDGAIYYFNQGAELNSMISANDDTLKFADIPSFNLLQGNEFVSFITELAGVGSSGATTWSGDDTNFTWTTNAMRAIGNANDPENEIDYWQVSNAAYAPPVTSGGVLGIRFSDPSAVLPVLAPIGNVFMTPGNTASVSVNATATDTAEILDFSLDPGAPPGATIDPGTGVFSWDVPAAEPPGQYPVTVRATDSADSSLSSALQFFIDVVASQQTTSLDAAASTGIYAGSTTLTATLMSDGAPLPGKTVAFTLNEGGIVTPVGTATTDASGVATLTGASLVGFNGGTYGGAVSATFAGDANYSASSDSGDLTVNVPLALAPIPDQTVVPGGTVTVKASATGTNASDSLVYSLGAGAPDGAAIDPHTGVFTWSVPASRSTGNYLVTVTVVDNSDGSLTATTSFVINVVANPNLQATSLSAVSGSGTYGGTATLTATLTSGGSPLAGKTVAFSLNEGGTITPVGMATTDANGVAALTDVSLAGFSAGTFTGAVGAGFAGDATDSPSNSSGDVTISPAQATLSLSGLASTYDGSPHTATVSTNPAGLGGVTVSYAQNNVAVAAPTQAGSYTVTAALRNPNYTATSVTGTMVIHQAVPTITWTDPADITSGAALGSTQLDATASVPGTFSYSPAAGTVLNAGQGQTLAVTFSPTDTTDYATVSGSTLINVLSVAAPPPPMPPHATGVVGVGRSKKGLISVTIGFNEALDRSSVENARLYSVLGAVTKRRKTIYNKPVGIQSIGFNGNSNVTINLAKPYKGAVQVTVLSGIVAANGAPSSGNFAIVVK
jgi:hypothetical protein